MKNCVFLILSVLFCSFSLSGCSAPSGNYQYSRNYSSPNVERDMQILNDSINGVFNTLSSGYQMRADGINQASQSLSNMQQQQYYMRQRRNCTHNVFCF